MLTRSLPFTIGRVFLLVLAGWILYGQPISRIVKNWFTFEGSNGLLILAISLYMAWTNRDRLRKTALRPNRIFGSAVLALGCLMLLSGQWSATLLIQELSLVVALIGLTWLLLGSSHLRILIVPICYLLFMFTVFEEILAPLSYYLQEMTAWIAAGLLRLVGMPVLLNDRYIGLPHITLEVARECDGSHHIIALVALAVPLSYLAQPTWSRRFIVVLSAFIVGVFANGLRVMLIGIWSARNGGALLHGPFNVFYASFIFFVGMILLILTTLVTTRRERKKSQLHGPGHAKEHRESLPFADIRRRDFSSWQTLSEHFRPVGFALAILIVSVCLELFHKPRPVYLASPLSDFPLQFASWTGEDVPALDGPFAELKAETEIKRLYRDEGGQEIALYIGYFPMQEQDREIINERFTWQLESGESAPVSLGSAVVRLRKVEQFDNGKRDVFYYWYDINGRILTGRYAVKLALVLDAFARQRTNGALIVIEPRITESQKGAAEVAAARFAGVLTPLVREYLSSL